MFERAEQIRQAFGPCSVIYECQDAAIIAESIHKFWDGDEQKFCQVMFEDEADFWWESLGWTEDSVKWDRVAREIFDSQAGISTRLAAIGIEVK